MPLFERAVLLLAVFGGLGHVVSATTLPLHAAATQTVQDLLDQELRSKRRSETRQPYQEAQVRPQLLGIWGVQKSLFARVQVGDRIVEFRQGRSAALAPYEQSYFLIAIQPPCLRFSAKKQVFRVCLK